MAWWLVVWWLVVRMGPGHSSRQPFRSDPSNRKPQTIKPLVGEEPRMFADGHRWEGSGLTIDD